jgi:secondary thiamine-phosphate synthase enzyme
MRWWKTHLEVTTHGVGLYPCTAEINAQIGRWELQEGMGFLFLPHTSASLVINESFDPSARHDLETFLDKLVPPGQPWMRHTLEGDDDSTSHLRALLTHTDLTIPIEGGRLALGTWQGVFLFEHRRQPHRRRLRLHVLA